MCKWVDLSKEIKDLNDLPLHWTSKYFAIVKIIFKKFKIIWTLTVKNTPFTYPYLEQRPQKSFWKKYTRITPSHLIIEALKKCDLIATRAAMLKICKTGKHMFLYPVNILSCKNFDDIHNINEL